MESIKRLSMNTSLKNARIFDDDAWEERDGIEVKKEIKTEPGTANDCTRIKTEKGHYLSLLNTFKKEPQDGDVKIKIEPPEKEINCEDKSESEDSDDSDYTDESDDTFDETIEDGEVKDISCSAETKERILCRTPPSPFCKDIKVEPKDKVDDRFDDSPYNKELFNVVRIKEKTPIKDQDGQSGNGAKYKLKSARRTVFSRLSPYKRVDEVHERKIVLQSRLGPKVDDTEKPSFRKYSKPRPEFESDHAVIARREKQIEYGKNTLGYDNYIRLVPRDERKIDDPQTPNKYMKYSRRGWDGLIRQWRLRLHKYDSPSPSPTTLDT